MEETHKKQQMISRRTTLLASLSRAEQFMQHYDEERDKLEVALRLENFDGVWHGLEKAQTLLEDIEDTAEGKVRNLEYRSSFEPLLFKIKAFLLSKLPPQITSHDNLPQNTTPGATSTLMGLKLPTIALPEFYGDYKDWLTFHDTFHALIHTNPDVAAIQKFHYLRAAVKGEAAQVIECIGISAANYQLAWEALVNRYANEYLLKKRHLQALFDCSSMKWETAASLHEIVDDFERHVKILGQLGEPVDSWSTILEHLLCTFLHSDTLKAWEDHASTLDIPTYKCLIGFLQRRMRVLESISVNQQHISSTSSNASVSWSAPQTEMFSNAALEGYQMKCHACNQNHPLIRCFKFERLPIAEKISLVNSKRLCLNCFRSDHFARNCSSKFSCRVCKRRHHSLIHLAFVDNFNRTNQGQSTSRPSLYLPTQTTSAPPDETSVLSATSAVNTFDTGCSLPVQGRNRNVFMLTVMLVVVDRYGKEHLVRALLDCASQPNVMSERMAQLLRLKRKSANVLIHGIGEKPQQAKESVCALIRSRKENFELDVEFLVLNKVTPELPSQDVPIGDWNLPKDIFLADPHFNKKSAIDMIIGNEHFFSCFKSAARIHLSNNLPLLVHSVFGWLVSGSSNVMPSPDQVSCKTVTAISLVSIEESIERFWEVEELQTRSNYSIEETQCEEFYASTVARNPDGRYMVRLPRRSDFDEIIGVSAYAARRRFELLEKKLDLNPTLREEYHNFMKEYVLLGHMRHVPNEDDSSTKHCFLPHHPVVKENSTTTKVRVVFDASARTSTGHSLNEALLVGPVVQEDLLTIMLRFRTFPVAIVADIEKMYRQVLMHPGDTQYQRIFWRFSQSDQIQTYELQTVTYGLGPSSFLATRTLIQLADDEGEAYPLGGPALKKGFYVDDFIGGAQSVEEAIQMRKELDELLLKGGFLLRKWTSNQLQVLQGLSDDRIGTQSSLKFDKDETVKALGISWEPEDDFFRFNSKIMQTDGSPTKREILSAISRLFDPLGLISPVVIRGKMMMQLLWLQSCGWDEMVPEDVAQKWKRYSEQLSKLKDFRIRRYALSLHSTMELHTFADASESAYGACIYARSIDLQGNITVHLLASKSRVAPLKRVSLPRLELCAADLAAKLHTRVMGALQIEVSASFFWSDSTVVLQWLKSTPNTWKTYIANRVSSIQTSTSGCKWRHVAGKENPADLVSRGLDAENFLASTIWKYGPAWLSLPEVQWPVSNVANYPEEGKERRKVVTTMLAIKELDTNPLFDRYSSHIRLVRITAFCLRFFRNCRNKTRTQPHGTGSFPKRSLTVDELFSAQMVLVRMAQADGFQAELRELQKSRAVSKQSSIRLLSPFLDPEGTIRVGGRLRLSDQPYIAKHPALLPSFHPYTRLLAIHIHLKLTHGGGRLTLATMRQQFWPINGRRLIRNIIRRCYQCARASPVPATQQIGQLPATRITPSRPFTSTGVDYAGPIYLKPIHKRAAAAKAYISIFVCFSTKAVHIELVSDLSTPAFLSALRRFIARRGRLKDIYSDNGKNFEGAMNELEELHRLLNNECEAEKIHSTCANEGINWHLIPPRAPHFGGLWEAAVKVAKKHLYRQVGNSRLSFEEMSTVLAEIEAAMNSRPLVPLSEDPNDLSCLTPAHFLVGSTMHAVAEPDVRSIPSNRLDNYQAIQRTFQQFWHHWRMEYLQEMQRCTTLNAPNNAFRPGRIVVIVDEFQHPVRWPLARIISIHPGKDRLTRVVTLKTSRGSSGIIKRPITKICLLPSDEMDVPITGPAENMLSSGEILDENEQPAQLEIS